MLTPGILIVLFQFSIILGQRRSPEIKEHPRDILIRRNEPATLNCKAEGKPDPTITWFKNGKRFELEEGRQLQLDNGDLFFLQVLQNKKFDDSGTYFCQASNDVSVVRSKNATLEIAVLSEHFSEEPKGARVSEGSTAFLRCGPPYGYPKPVVVWTKDGEELNPATQQRMRLIDNGTLVIYGVRVDDSGEYICKARNVYNTRESKPATLSVLIPPHLVSTSANITGTSDSTIEIMCRVGGEPQPEVYWEKVSRGDLPVDRMSHDENGQVLKISHAAPEDQGIYSCRAENPVGTVSANISLVIHSRPVISVSPTEGRVGINGTISFECKSTGNPPPTIFWTKEGTGVVIGGRTNERRVFVDKFNTLTLHHVGKADQGYYVCAAVGIAGSASLRSYLEVQSVNDMPPPLIALGAINQTLPIGTEAEMPCEVKGTPEPVVKWYYEDFPIKINDRMDINPLGTLRIIKLKPSDSGIYTCVATSASGTTKWSSSLVVARLTNPNIVFLKMPRDTALPEPPPHLGVISVNYTSVVLGWKKGLSGASAVLGYSIQLWSPDLRKHWTTANSRPAFNPKFPIGMIVSDLKPDTNYLFVVRARNSYGLSRPSEPTPLVKTLSLRHKKEMSLMEVRSRLNVPSIRLMTAVSSSSTSIFMRWQLLVDDSLLEGVYVLYRTLGTLVHSISAEVIYFHKNRENETPFSYTLTGLIPSTKYEIFLTPFYSTVEGQPSAAIRTSTLQSIPNGAPQMLSFSAVNTTAVRLSWQKIPNELSNGEIIGYIVQMEDDDESDPFKVKLNVTSTTVVIPALIPGNSYHATVLGMTALGLGPESTPLSFTLSEFAATEETTMSGHEFPAVGVETNLYLVVGIAATSILLFIFLSLAIFVVYRHRRKKNANPYFAKSDSKEPWCEYQDCWNDTCKSIHVRQSNTNPSIHSFSIHKSFQKGDSQFQKLDSTFQRNDSRFQKLDSTFQKNDSRFPKSDSSFVKFHDNEGIQDHYRVTSSEALYEDPDGLRLVSFAKTGNKRNFSPEPYATTPLISDAGRYNGSGLEIAQNLPANIPVADYKDANQLVNLIMSHNRMGNSYSAVSDRDASLLPILQFPPPPPTTVPDPSFSITRQHKEGYTRFLQQQLPYSHPYGSVLSGSSSSGSQKSYQSPMVNSRFPKMANSQDSHLIPNQELSLVVDPCLESFHESLLGKVGGNQENLASRSSNQISMNQDLKPFPKSYDLEHIPRSLSSNNTFQFIPAPPKEFEGEGSYSQPLSGDCGDLKENGTNISSESSSSRSEKGSKGSKSGSSKSRPVLTQGVFPSKEYEQIRASSDRFFPDFKNYKRDNGFVREKSGSVQENSDFTREKYDSKGVVNASARSISFRKTSPPKGMPNHCKESVTSPLI